MNGFLSKENRTEKGVRQGCPLSALLFIIFLEPLLNILRSNDWEAEPTDRRIISYADDVSVFVNKKDLVSLFAVIEKFCRGTQFRVNKDKSAVLTSASIEGYKCTNVIKVLGFFIGTEEEAELRNRIKIEADIRNARRLLNRHASLRGLRGKALIMGSFVVPKVLYVVRHMKQTLSIQKRFDQFSMDAIWGNGRKKKIALKYLQRTPKDGGIQWPNISAHIAASKTMDFKNSMCQQM